MIKGINRQIIEIGETGNLYFEKALLFVRPGADNLNDQHLKSEAKQMIGKWGKPPKMRKYQTPGRRLIKAQRIISAIFWSGFGATIFALTQRLFF